MASIEGRSAPTRFDGPLMTHTARQSDEGLGWTLRLASIFVIS